MQVAVVHAIALQDRNAALEESAIYRNFITNISLKIHIVPSTKHIVPGTM
jgi:hypothetical protein